MASTAKLFMHGRSQAVRLPKEFRLPGKEVLVSKLGDTVILEPIAAQKFDVDAFGTNGWTRWEGRSSFSKGRRQTPQLHPRLRASSSTNDLPRHQCRHRLH